MEKEDYIDADVDNLLDVDPLEPIRLKLDEEEFSTIYTWQAAL